MIAAVRRRPVWLVPIAVVGLLGLALAWYLVSPLFVRTTLVEGGAGTVGQVVARGTFNEIDAIHKGRGQALLIRNADGTLSVRLDDFSVTNGPDLYLYLSRHAAPASHDEAADGINLGRLKATEGTFSYTTDTPASADEFKSVLVYCQRFRVIFSVASLA